MIEVWQQFKATEIIPKAWRYRCVICKLEVAIPAHFIEAWQTFFACPVCKAWSEWWPKSPSEEVWEYLW